MNIGKRIKEIRTERHITQVQLAEAINVTQPMITYWENETCEPTASNILALANYFNVCADYLIGR